MKDDSTKKRYCPHLLETKLHAVEVYRKTRDISFVCRRYHISKASLMRVESGIWRNKKILAKEVPQTTFTSPQCPYQRGIEVDSWLPSSKSEHLHLWAIRKITRRKSLPPSPRLPIPRIRPPRVQEETGIHKEKIQAYRRIRYTDSPRRKVANGCEIRAKCLLFRKRRAEILSIYRHRRSVSGLIYRRVWSAKQLLHSGLFQTGNWILRLRSEHSANR